LRKLGGARMTRANVQRAKILEQAEKFFWEKGYDKTSMKDIARASGFNAGNIYYYFPSKESILYEILSGQMQELNSSIENLDNDESGDPIEQLRTVIIEHMNLTLGPWRISGMLFDMELKSLLPEHKKQVIKLRDTYDGILRKVIQRGIDKGLFRDGVNCAVTANHIASMIVRSRLWFSHKGQFSRDELVDDLFNFVKNGLVRQPALNACKAKATQVRV
jgi:TetR/AcrR family transcriptional regulator, cholesterol catabolism regulator